MVYATSEELLFRSNLNMPLGGQNLDQMGRTKRDLFTAPASKPLVLFMRIYFSESL